MKKALVTGIAGFAGSHLASLLLSKGIEVHGFYHPDHGLDNLNGVKNDLSLINCDVLDKAKVSAEIKKIQPDYFFHLAAYASPSFSFQNPQLTLQNNIFGEINILEAIKNHSTKSRVLIIGSADEYGNVQKKDLPIDENTPLAPASPYAVSKVAQDMLGMQYHLSYKLHLVRVRPFNHIGPRQSPTFVVPAFASQIAKLEQRGGGAIKVGNLEGIRDFTDVRDMVKAYLLALDKATPGDVYNIGSGKPIKIKKILEILISLSKSKITIEKDNSRFRPVDIKEIYCDFTKFKVATGWKPKIAIEDTLSDTIDYERSRLN